MRSSSPIHTIPTIYPNIPKIFQGDRAVNVARKVTDTAEVARGGGFESNRTAVQRLLGSLRS